MADRIYHTGPYSQSDGVQTTLVRVARTGEQMVSNVHARYYEQVHRGNVYGVSTAVAGVAPGTALSTTPPLAIHNPVGSGKDLVILMTSLGYVSGTIGAGTIVYANVPGGDAAVPASGTVLTAKNLNLGGAAGVASCHEGSTVDATPTIIRPAYILGAKAAATALDPIISKDYVDGEIVVPPGETFVMEGVAAAGTSPLLLFGVIWEEVDV